jgi:hypothetical protein
MRNIAQFGLGIFYAKYMTQICTIYRWTVDKSDILKLPPLLSMICSADRSVSHSVCRREGLVCVCFNCAVSNAYLVQAEQRTVP